MAILNSRNIMLAGLKGAKGDPASLDNMYPIGSIYMNVSSTSPASIFGGTWERLENRFLLAAGSSYTSGATGGEATHTLTTNEMPSHSHTLKAWKDTSGSSYGPAIIGGYAGNFSTFTLDNTDYNNKINNTGGGQAHNNMPPYLVVYMWKRTD